MKTTILKLTTLTVCLVLCTLQSCKKTESEANDPLIIEKTYNLTLTDTMTFPSEDNFAAKEIDIDGNGTKDLGIIAYYNYIDETVSDTTARMFVINTNGSNSGLLVTITPTVFGDLEIPKFLTTADRINLISTEYKTNAIPFARAFKGSTTLASFGVNDTNDKIMGLKFNIGTNVHTAWLRYSISADKKSITIKDGAYHNTPNAEITAGAK